MNRRYFIEVAYKGKEYAGFQVQENAHTIQAEVEQALKTYFRKPFSLTGSSRTDSGVNALQNFFHFDQLEMPEDLYKPVYHLNAILPPDVVVKGIYPVKEDAHCRFDALSRLYRYRIYRIKDPFLKESAYFYPYSLNLEAMQEAAQLVKAGRHFEAFSKKSTQVHTYECAITTSEWQLSGDEIWYEVEANRFLRGMVRGLVGTMLKVGTGKLSLLEFESLLRERVHATAEFSVPGHGLYLVRVSYPSTGVFKVL